MPYIYSELHANIQDSFYEAGVEIMSPVFHALARWQPRGDAATVLADKIIKRRVFALSEDDPAMAETAVRVT